MLHVHSPLDCHSCYHSSQLKTIVLRIPDEAMLDLLKFGRQYHQALLELVDAIPERSRRNVPPCLVNTGFVIALSDSSGRHAVELVGRERHEKIIINGVEARLASDEAPGFVVLPSVARLEAVLFPGTTDKSSVQHRMEGHVHLLGLYYASAEFHQNHKLDGFKPQFVGGDVPFKLTGEGSLLAINCAHGYVANGTPEIRAIDWLRVFGSDESVPVSTLAIRELAITDLSSAVLKLRSPETNWKFEEFLSSLKGPVDTNVLLLGPYSTSTEDQFSDAKVALESLGYTPFLLKDAPDLPIQKNREKLFAAVMFSSFIVVIDDHASGHLSELQVLIQSEFRPAIILRRTETPATAFLEDELLTSDSFRVEVMPSITAAALTPAIRWAREWLASREKDLNAINKWRK